MKGGYKMKKVISLVAGLLLCATSAFAQPFWTGSVFNNSLGAFVGNVQGFDWSSSGSGLAVGLPAGTVAPAGTSFNFLYQASLVGLTNPSGQSVSFPGLNTAFEYTVVAQLPETVISSTALGGGLFNQIFRSNAGGTFAIYNQAAPNAVVATGKGFNDGTLVAKGSISANQLTSFTGTTTSGLGSTILEGLVTFANPLFLDPALSIVDFRFEGTVNLPPLDSTTTSFFDGNDGFAVTPVGSNTLFKVDGSSKFSVVPEPSTVLLMGVGLLGVAGFARRRMKG